MKRLMLGVAVCALSLFSASAAQAAPPVVVAHGHAARPYYATHGVRYSGGYYYAGRSHTHWSYRTYDTTCRRYHYYDPCLRVYFYWCPERCGYYPVSPIVLR